MRFATKENRRLLYIENARPETSGRAFFQCLEVIRRPEFLVPTCQLHWSLCAGNTYLSLLYISLTHITRAL